MLPKITITYNGPPFSSYEFNRNSSGHIIKLMQSPPWYTENNGLAARTVQDVKQFLKVGVNPNWNDLIEKIKYVLRFSCTGNLKDKSPAILLLNC